MCTTDSALGFPCAGATNAIPVILPSAFSLGDQVVLVDTQFDLGPSIMVDGVPGYHGAASDPACYNCGIRGHWFNACPEPTRKVPA